MSSSSWIFIVPTAIGAVLMFLGQALTSWLTSQVQRRQYSGRTDTVPGNTVFDEGQRIISWYEREIGRLRQVEDEARKAKDELLRLKRQYEQLETRCHKCPNGGVERNGAGA